MGSGVGVMPEPAGITGVCGLYVRGEKTEGDADGGSYKEERRE